MTGKAMNWLDYILVFIILLNLYNGLKSGFMRQVLRLFSILIAFYVALFWSNTVKTYLQCFFKLEEVISVLVQKGGTTTWLADVLLNIIAFLLVFLLVNALLVLISRKLRFLQKIPLVGPLNALIGGALGTLKGIIIILLITALLSLIKTDFWSNTIDASAIVSLSRYYLPLLFGFIFDYLIGKLGKFA